MNALAQPLLEELLEGASDCIFIVDADWRIIYLNGIAIAEIERATRERPLIGKDIWQVFPQARGSLFEREYRRALHERSQVVFEAYFPPLQAWYEVKATPLSHGGLVSWFRNISARKEADRALAAAEERYRLAAMATNDLVWDWDLVTNSVAWNDGPLERLGYDSAELGTQLQWWADRIHPVDGRRVLSSVKACTDGATDHYSAEYRFLAADGSYADIYDRGYVIRDGDGRAIRMVGAMQDNTSRNRALNELREQKTQLATVFGQAMVGISHYSMNGEVLMVNQRLCEILGRTEEELRIWKPGDFSHPDDLWISRDIKARYFDLGKPYQIEKRYLRPDGSTVWCEVSVSFVRGDDEQPVSSIVIVQDITARKEAEAALARQSSLVQNVIDSVADLIFVKDRTGKFTLTNRALDEGCGPHIGSSRPEDVVGQYRDVDREVMSSGELRSIEEMISIRGEQRLFQTVKVPWIRDGEIAGVIGVSRDITERKCVENALRESEMLYRSVLEASADSIKILDRDGRLELMNAAGLTGSNIEDFELIRGKDWASLWPEEFQDLARAAVADAQSGKVSRFTGMCQTLLGVPKWWDVQVSPMCDDSGRVVRILSISRDITAQRDTAERLKWASEHDELTELPNRSSFQAHLQAATIRAMGSASKLGLLLIDLDHFKHVNDALGHAAGDHLLAEFGKRLRECVRSGDFVARLGGDEFAVILENVHDDEDLVRLGSAILSRLRVPVRYNDRTMSAGVSIGGAIFPRDAECAQELFNGADIALYVMKESGRGGTQLFHQHMKQQARTAASQLSLARFALSETSVVPHYQPKVCLKTGKVVGHEALLRWRHPLRGVQLPETVAEAFKDYELASRIGELMQRGVLADMRQWLDQGQKVGSVAINAAPAEFLRDDFAERLLAQMREFDVPPCLLEVEVTEHVFFDRSSDYVSRALRVLKDAGVRIALDDFGTGYSSLSHLRDFPVDVVKIDRTFVNKMADEPEIAAIVSAVISLASSLKLDVVAEGVETEQQRLLLKLMRCSIGQGYLFGRAVEAARVGQAQYGEGGGAAASGQ